MFNRLFQGWFGRRQEQTPPPGCLEPPPELTDADLKSLFTELLEGVSQQRGQAWALKFLKNIEHRVSTERWIEWLRRFCERLLASRAPNKEWAARMVQLGELRIGEVGDVAYEIGMQLFGCNPGEPMWEYDRSDVSLSRPSNQREVENSQEDQTDAWFKQTNQQYNTVDYRGAVANFDEALQLQWNFPEAWYNQGVAVAELQQYEVVLASDEALQLRYDDPKAWTTLGVRIDEWQHYQKVIAAMFADGPLIDRCDDSKAWDVLGSVVSELQQYKVAIILYNQALQLRWDFSEAWLNRGVALANLQQYEAALASYNRALQLRWDFPEAWFNRGVALANLQQYEAALASYNQALQVQWNYLRAWFNRGLMLANLQQYEAEVASYDQVLKLQRDFPEAWFNRGVALANLQQYEEAIASYDRAIKIKPDDHKVWYSRGFALNQLKRFEEAIASYDKAIAIKPDFYEACFRQGFALNQLKRFEEAIASYDKAIAIKPDFYEAWNNRGIAAGISFSCDPFLAFLSTIARQNPALNQRGYEGKLASYEEGLKQCQEDTRAHREGRGRLHQAIGNAHYFRGRDDSRPRIYWRKAVKSYKKALLTLTEADYPEVHLGVLQDLIPALSGLGQIAEAEELQRRGTDLLQRLLKEPNCSEHNKKQLALKFAGFGQLTVDLAVQSGNWCAALEIAEQGKNACLSWILGAWSDEISSSKWEQIKQLLNPTTAVVYWHLSPAALHAFILKHDAPSPILITTPTQTTEEELPAAVRRLRDFENWVQDWDREYANYRKGKDKEVKAENDWRDNLPKMLQQLASILDIPAILELIQNPKSKIQNLILIPHRDLHRFPLHALFPDNYTITYLPSAQMGINLLGREVKVEGHLLSVEHPNSEGFYLLHHAEIESAAITQLFNNPAPKRIAGEEATNTAVKEALKDGYSIFHFTGHSTYNFQDPKQSALILNGTDYLTLAEIGNIDNLSSYQLINLSACETAITGNQAITTEYVGLVSVFLYQRAAHVVSTLWTVTDDASSFLMIYFYWQLKKGKSPAIALAKATKWLRNLTDRKLERIYKVIFAQLPPDEKSIRPFIRRKLRQINEMELSQKQQKRFDHPYYWAAFIITGGYSY